MSKTNDTENNLEERLIQKGKFGTYEYTAK
jgi:hypothetical protein